MTGGQLARSALQHNLLAVVCLLSMAVDPVRLEQRRADLTELISELFLGAH